MDKRHQHHRPSFPGSSAIAITSNPGTILWLPARDKIADEDIEEPKYSGADGCYNHPVLLFRTNATRTEATALIVS